jgi:cathepsin L
MRRALTGIAFMALAVAMVAARPPKAHELKATYTYDRYLADFNKAAPETVEEYAMRRSLFDGRVRAAMAHNAKRSSWTEGVNYLSDRTDDEIRVMRGGKASQKAAFMSHPAVKATPVKHMRAGAAYAAPVAVDWRGHTPSVLSAVKDQGMCGSCWAHAAAETIESHYAIQKNQLFTLSQQQLVACAPNPNQCGGTGGCSGSIAELAYSYIYSAGGMTQEWVFPYVSYSGLTNGTCPTVAPQPYVKISGYTKLEMNDALTVMQAVAEKGPIAVNVDASTWGPYEGGIFAGCNYANNISIDHVVQLVGYGFDQGLDQAYWIVRNSWSPAWGESGFIRISREMGTPNCGWNVNPQNGVACKGQTAPQWTCGMCGILFDTSFPNI